MQPPRPVLSALYEILVVRPPNDRLSNLLRYASLLLVASNTLALIVSYTALSSPEAILFIGVVETLSTAFFGAEYVLRLCSASADPGFRSRLGFALRPLSLVDLAAALPLFVAAFAPTNESALRVLRIGWVVRHLKVLRYLAFRPLVHGSDPLVQTTVDRLAEIRGRVADTRERDFSRVQGSLRAGVRKCVEASRAGGDARVWRVMALLDELETEVADADRIREAAGVIATAYRDSAGAFDAAAEDATVEVALGPGFVGRKAVPLREIGRYHFTGLASQADRFSESKDPLYAADVSREVATVRKALSEASAAEGASDDEALTNAIDQLRDVDAPARLAWDALLFQFEEEHRARMQLVRTDIERHGHPSFHAGRLWRGLVRRLNATLHAGELTVRIWTRFVRFYREAATSVAHAVRQTLLRLGVLKPPMHEMLRALDEARIDSVLGKGLPADYLAHFDVSAPKDDGNWIGFDEELRHLRGAVERWQSGQLSSVVVYGHRGVGKTTFLHQARMQLFAESPFVHDGLTQKLTSVEALVGHLGRLLGIGVGVTPEAFADAVLVGPRRAIFLDDAHHLFFRTIGGLDAVRYLFWLIARTNHHVFWGISLDRCGYEFLAETLPLGELFHLHVNLDERTSEDLRRLIMTRHGRSGVSLNYVRDKRNEKAFRKRMKALRQRNRSGQAQPQEALELIFFDRLKVASAGNVLVAAFYWLRSLRIADEDRYHVDPLEPLDLSLIWEFSEDQAFILAALLQHGMLETTELGRILDVDQIGLRLELEILSNLNVLQSNVGTDTFRVNPVVQQTVCDVLRARNLLR